MSLTYCLIKGNNIEGDGAKALAEALESNGGLQHLDFECGSIQREMTHIRVTAWQNRASVKNWRSS